MRRASATLPPHYRRQAQFRGHVVEWSSGPAESVGPGRAEQLFREIELYLAAVARYRQLDCEPTWESEQGA